jgi:hypothetical protein
MSSGARSTKQALFVLVFCHCTKPISREELGMLYTFTLRGYILMKVIGLGIPTFSSHEEHRRHILIHTAAVFRDFSRKGFTEGMSGHISVRDPEFEDYIWMNPLGKHFGLMTAGDLICLDVNTGKIVGGNKVRLLSISSQCSS